MFLVDTESTYESGVLLIGAVGAVLFINYHWSSTAALSKMFTQLWSEFFPKPSFSATVTMPYGEGGTYIGSASDGEPEGFGILMYRDDILYAGQWDGGQEHGTGSLIKLEDGSTFTGVFCRGEVVKEVSLCDAMLFGEVQRHMYFLTAHVLNDVKEDMDEWRSTTEHVHATLDLWQSKFDRVCELAQNAGVDPFDLMQIKEG